MDIIIMIVIFGFVVFIATHNSRKFEERLETERQRKKNCPPHKWVYRQQPGTEHEYMICNTCGILPGESHSEVNDDED